MVKSNIYRIFAMLAALLIAFSLSSPIYAKTPDEEISKYSIDSLNIGNDYEIIGVSDSDDITGAAKILAEYRNVIVGVSGVATLTFVLLFIFNFIKLGKSSGNPQERSHCIMALIITGIATAGCGGVLIFVSFFYNLLA